MKTLQHLNLFIKASKLIALLDGSLFELVLTHIPDPYRKILRNGDKLFGDLVVTAL